MVSFPPLPLCNITSLYCPTPKMQCNITSFYCPTPKMQCNITSFYCPTPKTQCSITSFYCLTPKMQCNITPFYCSTPKHGEVHVKPCQLLKVTSFASLSYPAAITWAAGIQIVSICTFSCMGQQAQSNSNGATGTEQNGTKSTGQRAWNKSVQKDPGAKG